MLFEHQRILGSIEEMRFSAVRFDIETEYRVRFVLALILFQQKRGATKEKHR